MDLTEDEVLKERLKELKATYSTKSFKKLWNYFLTITKGDYFQKKVSKIRKLYQIPTNGFDRKKTFTAVPYPNERGDLSGAIKINEYDIWKGSDPERSEQARKRISKETDNVCRKYNLHFLDWGELMEDYFLFNELSSEPPQLPHSNSFNLCWITDLAELAEEPFGTKLTREDNKIFPIALRISPYASENDIVDYVKKMFPVIKSYQKPYIKPGIKIGKIKKKNPRIQLRNNFIYQNRKLPLNELKKLVEKNFNEFLDYEYIGKIKSEEIKKRKNV